MGASISYIILSSSIVTDLVMAYKTSHTSSSDLSVHCALQEASKL